MKSIFTRGKLAGILAAAVLASGMLLGGCGSGATKTSSGGAASSGSSGSGGGKLVIGLQANPFITDYKNNYLTNLLEKKLNIDLEFYMLPTDATEVKTKVSLMVASRDNMPDVLITNSLTPEAILDYGSKGAFIKLNKYVNDSGKAPNFAAIAKEDKSVILDSITSADGNIYSLPDYEPETWNLTPYRMYLNGSWLKKLNLSTPTTTDELYKDLKAFRDNDANGNGVQDEVGVYGYADGGYGENTVYGLMNSFVFYNGGGQNGGLALDKSGKVIAPFTTDGWKAGLKYLNKLYKEKLLSASMFTDDQTQFKATLNSATPVVGFVSAGSTSNWTDVDHNNNFQQLDLISPLKGPEGLAYTPYTEYAPAQVFFITSSCKNPDLAFKLGDTFLSKETSTVARFGEEGVDWSSAPAELAKTSNAFVDSGLYKSLSLVYKTNIWAQPSNKFWHNINPRYCTLERGNTVGNAMINYDPSLKTAKLGAYSYKNYYPAHPEKVLPLLHYNAKEAKASSEAITNITDYVKQSVAEFVTGARDIDSGWKDYLSQMSSMGLKDWIKNAQSAYDRTK